MKKFLFVSAAVAGVAFATAASAVTLTISDGVNPDITIADGDAADLDPTSDAVFAVQTIGGFSVTFGTSSTVTPAEAFLQDFSLRVSGSGGPLTISVTEDYDLTGSSSTSPLLGEFDITPTTINGTLAANVVVSQGGDTGVIFDGDVSGDESASVSLAPPIDPSLTFAVMTTYTFDDVGPGLGTSFDAVTSVSAIPLPAPILMLLAAAGGLVLVARRRSA